MGMSSDTRSVRACRRWPSLGSACSPGPFVANQIAHHAEIRGVAHAAPGRPPSPGNINRDPNAELKGLTVSSAEEWKTVSSAEEWKPGQDTHAVATARLQEQDPDKIHCPAWGVVGNMGDSICY